MDHENVKVKVEFDDEDESISNLVTPSIISHDSTVTCGNCKKQMSLHEYIIQHRKSHYYLCWLEGVEDKIDFTDTSQVQKILKENSEMLKTKSKFVCEWCDDIKLTIAGFSKHLKNCVAKTMLCENDINQEDLQKNSSSLITYSNDSIVSCGRCKESMKYAEYKNEHRYKHYNLCWLDGEEKLDYSNQNKITELLKEILPKLTENVKKYYFICEWCGEKRNSLLGFAIHVMKCAKEQNFVSLQHPELDVSDSLETIDKDSKYDSDSPVTCGLCNNTMLYKEFTENHKATHYNLCWINGDEKVDLDDVAITQPLLRQTLPKDAAREKKVKFVCEWCQVEKKSVPGFASHLKQCKLRPDKLNLINDFESGNDLNKKSEIEVTNASIVTCGRCNKEMTYIEYCSKHCSKHNNLCWIVGEDKPDLENYDVIVAKLKQFVPFSVVRSRSVKLTCEDCKSVKRSISGFASHVIFCNKTANDIKLLLVRCEDCGTKIKPSSFLSHRLKNCKGANSKVENSDKTENNWSNYIDDNALFYKMRRKRRPPNVLSFHPNTKYVTEYFDLMCRLCDFVTFSINDITNHISTIHNIDLNLITSKKIMEDYILSKNDVHQNIYLIPLLNYYQFYIKTFWKAIYHGDFKCNVKILNNEEALRYLPSIQQSCKVFNSNNEQICVSLFKSAHVNGKFMLFTGGPNWALSWCPVPKEVQTQYLAISCHPKPDLLHKEMNIYKYPSLLQLWKFNSLSNINYESVADMPYMSYGLAHDFGAVWDMAWCPSGAYEPNNKIGLLALSTSCGDCPIFAMPCTDENSEMFYIYKAKPVIARNFECEWIEGGVQCTKVCWQAIAPFKTVICGYSNGIVSLFNINFKSIFLNDEILYPSHTFRASRCSITGLSMNYFNSLILSTTATDGHVTLWDLKSTEIPIFQKKSYSPSDCTWLQQCYTLVYCSKGVNPLFLKVRTINFSNYNDDVEGYNPELYVIKSVINSSKIISNNSVVNNDSKLNNDVDNCNDTVRKKPKIKAKKTTLDDSLSDDESFKFVDSDTNSDGEKSNFVEKSGDVSKSIDEDDLYGPTFFQRSTHWSVSASDWMNIIATGDEGGVIYEKLFLPENNHIKKENCATLQLIVRKLNPNDTSNSEVSNYSHFNETIKIFGLEFKSFRFDENIMSNKDDTKPLLRYPLDNITKVSWNQNFSSFRWLAIGTQSGFTLVSPSQTISDNYIDSFYKIISTELNKC